MGWDGFSHRLEVRSRLRSRGRHNQGMIRRLTGPFLDDGGNGSYSRDLDVFRILEISDVHSQM